MSILNLEMTFEDLKALNPKSCPMQKYSMVVCRMRKTHLQQKILETLDAIIPPDSQRTLEWLKIQKNNSNLSKKKFHIFSTCSSCHGADRTSKRCNTAIKGDRLVHFKSVPRIARLFWRKIKSFG